MLVNQKFIPNDINSELVDELVDQVNNSLFTNSFYHYMTATPTESSSVVLGIGERGVLVKDFVIGFNFITGEYISSADTEFTLEMSQTGNFDTVTELVYRKGFDVTPIEGGSIGSIQSLAGTTSRGILPLFIPPMSQVRFRVNNQEGVDRELTLHIVCRPTEYELVQRPHFKR